MEPNFTFYTDSTHRIVALNTTARTDVTEHRAVREEVFPGMLDTQILLYKYEETPKGYTVYLAVRSDLVDQIAAFYEQVKREQNQELGALQRELKETKKQLEAITSAITEGVKG